MKKEEKIKELKKLGFKFSMRGNLIGYKTFNEYYPPNPNWNIKKGSFLQNYVRMSKQIVCSEGINFGTNKWVRENCNKKTVWKLKVYKSDFCLLCIPNKSDGKVRCGKCKLIRTVGTKRIEFIKKIEARFKKRRKCTKCKYHNKYSGRCKRGLWQDRDTSKWATHCSKYKRGLWQDRDTSKWATHCSKYKRKWIK